MIDGFSIIKVGKLLLPSIPNSSILELYKGGIHQMILLTEIIKTSPEFLEMTTENREVFSRLAAEFQDNDLALHLTPTELAEKLQIGNKFQWQTFLQLETVKVYIKQQMSFNAEIASRKTFQSLTESASKGDTQAARQVNELAGVHNKGDNNKVVILHQISRPKLKQTEAPTL